MTDQRPPRKPIRLTLELGGRESSTAVLALGILSVLPASLIMLAFLCSPEEDLLVPRIVTGCITVFAWWVLLKGIQLKTQSRWIIITESEVTDNQRSWVWRRTRRWPLSEFAGLVRTARFEAGSTRLAAGNADTQEASVIWEIIAVLIPFPLPGLSRRGGLTHCLILRHTQRRRSDLLLIRSRAQGDVHDVMIKLHRQAGLPILDHSMEGADGFIERSPEEIDVPLIERVTPSVRLPQLLAEPLGVRVDVSDEAMTIHMSIAPKAWVLGVCVGVPVIVFGVRSAIQWGIFGREGNPLLWIVVFLMIGPAVLLMIRRARQSHQRPVLRLDRDEVRLLPRKIASRFPWSGVRHVAVARETRRRRLALVITTDRADHWIGGGNSLEVLAWTRDAILAKASRVAGQHEERS
jgi:hypothetical protein